MVYFRKKKDDINKLSIQLKKLEEPKSTHKEILNKNRNE